MPGRNMRHGSNVTFQFDTFCFEKVFGRGEAQVGSVAEEEAGEVS